MPVVRLVHSVAAAAPPPPPHARQCHPPVCKRTPTHDARMGGVGISPYSESHASSAGHPSGRSCSFKLAPLRHAVVVPSVSFTVTLDDHGCAPTPAAVRCFVSTPWQWRIPIAAVSLPLVDVARRGRQRDPTTCSTHAGEHPGGETVCL